jgi:hypothetical protein
MMIPSIKQILLFFTVNFFLIAIFNIILSNGVGFITHVRFSNIFVLNTLKIGTLVSVFLLTTFMVNLLFFVVFIKNDFKRSLLSTIKMSIGMFLAGIIFATIIVLAKGF